MNPSEAAATEIGLSWQMREHEARLLADSLRTSRLTLLYAVAGASRKALLRDGVVPLMARRESDAAVDPFLESHVVEPFVDRRGGELGREHSERIVYFDRWDEGDPLDGLLATVGAAFAGVDPLAARRQSLADTLQGLSERLSVRLLVVLDAAEQLWSADASAAITARFVDAFAEAVNRPGVGANFLLAVDDRFEGRLEALRCAIPRFDDSTVRLLGFDEVVRSHAPVAASLEHRVVLPAPAPAPPGSAGPPTLVDAVSPHDVEMSRPPAPAGPRRRRPPKVPVPPSAPIGREGVYAFIESRLGEVASPSEPWHDDAPPVVERRRAPRGLPRDFEPTRPMGDADALREPIGAGPASGESPKTAVPVTPRSAATAATSWFRGVLAWCRRHLASDR